MVKFVAKNLPVDNSNLSELDNYKPFKPMALTIGTEANYKNGFLTVKVTQDGALKYKIAKIEVERGGINKLFKGDAWEAKLFKGADAIKGSTDADMLYGFDGADVIHGKSGDDTIYGGKGKDELYGEDGGDTIFGNAGNDFLDGGAGINTLTGGGGKDTFAFSAALVGGNYAQIDDFQGGKDKIQLAKSAFEGIGAKGTLKAGQFFLIDDYDGTAKAVIYDPTNGNMHYAKDAGGNALDAPIFGRIANNASLTNSDFLIA